MNPAALAKVKAKIRERTLEHAERIVGHVLDTHATAPREGRNKNQFGEFRSAPFKAPAVETGTLYDLIATSLRETKPGHWTFMVNYADLEFGKGNTKPRPLGRIALDDYKASR